ncbi:MAG: hypothetical protein DDT23_00933 [candidate division WS2 bacterium]|nr:hypothetical protein [Candidatus Lithacetigena glycinireducens]
MPYNNKTIQKFVANQRHKIPENTWSLLSETGLMDSSDQVDKRLTVDDLRDVAVWMARDLGLKDIALDVESCSTEFVTRKCRNCQLRPATVFHCDLRLCPRCYYRNLFRFFHRHKSAMREMDVYSVISVAYGMFLAEDVPKALEFAKEVHKKMLKALPLLFGGIYHIEIKRDEKTGLFWINYHYLINGTDSWAIYFAEVLGEKAWVYAWKQFTDRTSVIRYFIRECCRYPTSVILSPDYMKWYLDITARMKLIQGFGDMYKITGGRMKGKKLKLEHKCPRCGGKLEKPMRVSRDQVRWDKNLKCWVYVPPTLAQQPDKPKLVD